MYTYKACAADRESRTYIDSRMVYVLGSEYKQNGEKAMKKFELTSEVKMHLGRTLYRIKACVAFGDVKAGELGGFVEKEENLSQDGNAWVYGDARVYGNAWVYGNAEVCGNAEVYGNARVCGNARVYVNARVYGNAKVYVNARVCGNAEVCGDARVYGNAEVCGNAWVYGDAEVYGDARVYGDADYAVVKGFGSQFRATTFFRQKDKTIGVRCGCFYGTLAAFREKVKETHGETKMAKEYLMIAELMEYHFEGEGEKNDNRDSSN